MRSTAISKMIETASRAKSRAGFSLVVLTVSWFWPFSLFSRLVDGFFLAHRRSLCFRRVVLHVSLYTRWHLRRSNKANQVIRL